MLRRCAPCVRVPRPRASESGARCIFGLWSDEKDVGLGKRASSAHLSQFRQLRQAHTNSTPMSMFSSMFDEPVRRAAGGRRAAVVF